MPSVTYMNQSAPFWDWVASLEQGASNPAQTHPWFTNQNTNNEEAQNPEAEGESAREHDGPAHLPPPPPPFAPWGWGHGFGGGRGFPFRGPPPHHRHGRRHERENEEHEHRDEKEDNNEKEGEKNDNGEGPSGSGSGSETEGGHRRCGGRRGGKGRCGSGGRGRHGWGPYHEGPGHHGPRGFGGPGPHHGGPHHGGPHGHGRRGGPWGGRGGFNPWAFAANWLNPENFMAGAAKEGEETTDFSPEADIFDTTTTFVVHISLPGAKKEDVGVNWDAEKSELSIAGVVYRPGDEDFLKTLAMDERKVGPFERKIRLGTRANPAQVDAEGITAKLEDGILRVEVPKRLDDGFVEVRKVDIE